MNLLDFLDEKYIFLNQVFDTKTEVLNFLLEKLRTHPNVKDFNLLVKDLWEREAKGGTALDSGVALPHARTNAVSDIILVLLTLAIPLDFSSPDGKPTQFVFLLAVPKERVEDYLEVVGHIMRIMKRESVREKLLNCKSPGEVLTLFSDLEVK